MSVDIPFNRWNHLRVADVVTLFKDAPFAWCIAGGYAVELFLGKQIRHKKKIYCVDNGLINAVTTQFSRNHGRLLENLVYAELKKNGFSPICFDLDKQECDFIAKQKNELFAFQVCYQLTPDNTARECAGLMHAMEKYNIQKGYIITFDQTMVIPKTTIDAISFWQFFGIEQGQRESLPV